MKTLIKNGRIVTATDDFMGDILIENEKIIAIGKSPLWGLGDVEKTLDATGKLVFPGAIDPHVHLEMPFSAAHGKYQAGTQTNHQQSFDGMLFLFPGIIVLLLLLRAFNGLLTDIQRDFDALQRQAFVIRNGQSLEQHEYDKGVNLMGITFADAKLSTQDEKSGVAAQINEG